MDKPDGIVKEIENYLTAQRIDKIVKEMVVGVLHKKPENVEEHMLKHLLVKNKASDGEVAIASVDDGPHVAFVHPDDASHQYLISKGIHNLFATLLQRLAEEKPEDEVAFILSELKGLR